MFKNKTWKKKNEKSQGKKRRLKQSPNLPIHLSFIQKTPLLIFVSLCEKNKQIIKQFKMYSRRAEGHILKWQRLKTILKLLDSFLRKKMNPCCLKLAKHTVGLTWKENPMQGLGNSKLYQFSLALDLELFILIKLKGTSGLNSKRFHKNS